jgi:hypothetical protein
MLEARQSIGLTRSLERMLAEHAAWIFRHPGPPGILGHGTDLDPQSSAPVTFASLDGVARRG